MVDKKEEVKEEKPKKEKKVVKKGSEKFPILQLVMECGEDQGIVVGALNKKGLYLQFIDDLENNNQKLQLSKEEFEKIIEEFKKGEL